MVRPAQSAVMKHLKLNSSLPTTAAWLISTSLLLINLHVMYRRRIPAPATQPIPQIPRATVHPLLHAQNLSHAALHSTMRMHLAALFRPRAIGVVGVASGTDVRAFAAAGYRVHAVEPGVEFVRALRAEVAKHPDWIVDVHAYAAADRSDGSRTVEYLKSTVAAGVPTRRLDDLLSGDADELAVLSVDVQGHEPGVLRGATGLLPRRVHSLWVEAAACHESLPKVLRLLDEHYVLFDFVPRGRPQGAVAGKENIFRHMWEPQRPSGFAAYEQWICRRSKAEFAWTQTDFLAVRRDLLPDVWPGLSALARNYCGRQAVSCKIIGR